MARISTYQPDNNVTARDKVIGTDFSGSVTKNFTLESIANLFSKGYVSVAGQSGYKFSDVIGNGTITGPNNNSLFSSLTSIRVSQIDAAAQNIAHFILEYRTKKIIIFDIVEKDNYGIYNVMGIDEDIDNPGYFIFTLADVSGNGIITLDKFYSIALFGGGEDFIYTHHQNNESTQWIINHNLGKFPSVSIKFSSSDQVYENVGAFAGVHYIDKDNLTINLAAAESGYAYLN